MAKLYPPYIEGTIPAFTGTVITVPFSMNRAVSNSSVGGFSLKVKTVNGTVIGTYSTSDTSALNQGKVSFSITDTSNYSTGQFYKIQLAYTASGVIGYYSTVGVVKYTNAPSIGLTVNSDIGLYILQYTNTDSTEKLYSSYITLYNSNNQIVYDSGDVLHSAENDNGDNSAIEQFKISQIINESGYYVSYGIKTVNGIEMTGKRNLTKRTLLSSTLSRKLKLIASYDAEEGRVVLNFKYYKDDDEEYDYALLNGNFIIVRRGGKDGDLYRELQRAQLFRKRNNRWYFYDYAVEQGMTYQYAIQQYNTSTESYSEYFESNKICVDFEHMFLYDGDIQLKIKYNPKVTSFKTDVLESKVDTIGSQYPWFVRNGNVSYKEFPISGLISHQSDEERKFMSDEDLGIKTENLLRATTGYYLDYDIFQEKVQTNSLSAQNIAAERLFKLKVLDWLNNGKVKLFKSPTEGNYLVRTMNASLAPNDVLGRMIHTVTCTAYEVGGTDFDTLYDNGIIPSDIIYDEDNYAEDIEILSDGEEHILPPCTTISISATPGTKVTINDDTVIIGPSGTYDYENTDPESEPTIKVDFTDVDLPDEDKYASATITKYIPTYEDGDFALVASESNKTNIVCQQFYGWYDDSIEATGENKYYYSDIFSGIRDLKTNISEIKFMRFRKKDIKKIYTKSAKNISNYKDNQVLKSGQTTNVCNETFYISTEDLSNGNGISGDILIQNLLKSSIYQIVCDGQNTGCTLAYYPLTETWLFRKNQSIDYSCTIYISKNATTDQYKEYNLDLTDTAINIAKVLTSFSSWDLDLCKFKNFGIGLILEMGYVKSIVTYDAIEKNITSEKSVYNTAKTELETAMMNEESSYQQYLNFMNAYHNYVKKVKKEYDNYNTTNGLAV